MPLTDSFNRQINYLRISVTDRCNLRCKYCMPNGHMQKFKHCDILTYEEILHIVKVLSDLGISKVRITGGEPLVRKGIFDFIRKLNKIKNLKDISITTNGVLLNKESLSKLKDAGIKRLNISLDTLNKNTFKQITGFDLFDNVSKGIKLATDMGFDPIKINVVALKGINDNEFKDFARLTIDRPYHIRFIEYMPLIKSEIDENFQILADEIKNKISILGKLEPIRNKQNDGPALRYKFLNAKGEIGFIRPISDHFCHKCNRLRLTAIGQISTCLLSGQSYDIKNIIRSGDLNEQIDEKLSESIKKTVLNKPKEHHLKVRSLADFSNHMSAIGG